MYIIKNMGIADRLSFSDYYRDALEKAKNGILRESDTTIVGTKVEDMAEYYFQKYAIRPVLFDDSRDQTWKHEKYIKTIRAHERESFYQSSGDVDFECERIKGEIPILPNEHIRIIAYLRSSTFSPSFSEKQFDFLENKVAFSVETKGYGFSHDEDQIARNVEAQFERARQLVAWKNGNIESENARLKQMIAKIIAERAQKIHQDEEKLSSLTKKISIPLKRKEDFAARNISLSSKPIIKKVKPTPT